MDVRTTQENEIIERFPLDAAGADRQIGLRFRILATALIDRVPYSRERALALTKLEEALMWAAAGIARHQA